jgi:RNA polymerase sigma-70 factor (ECF subfamily)
LPTDFVTNRGLDSCLHTNRKNLIQLILDGNAEAFCELVRPHQHVLYLKPLSIVHSEADAEEVVQNAVFNAFKKRCQFRYDSQFRTWLMSITINESRMWLRRHRKFRHESIDYEDDSGRQHVIEIADSRQGPFEVLEKKQVRGAILKALTLLPSCNSQVFILRDLQLLSVSETAKILGISEVSVRTRLWRGRGQMRQAPAHLRANRSSVKDHRSNHSASRRLRDLATPGSSPRNPENEMGSIH